MLFISQNIDFATVYPVGTILAFHDDVDRSNYLGLTWERYAEGRVLVGKSSDTEFDTIGKTGGAKTHTLTVNQIPAHKHNVFESNGTSGGTWTLATEKAGGTNKTSRLENTGGGQAHNNLQPYITVAYWRRTA